MNWSLWIVSLFYIDAMATNDIIKRVTQPPTKRLRKTQAQENTSLFHQIIVSGPTESSAVTKKSGKSKSGKSSDCKAGKTPSKECQVTVTNLAYRQAFGEVFIMLHDQNIINEHPLYEFGKPPSSEICALTQNLDASGLVAFYYGKPGVKTAWVESDFFANDSHLATHYLQGGSTFKFSIGRNSNYISIAAGFPFANDGGFILQGAMVSNGAEYYLPALDSGCEANLQTCWSVPATQGDFQNFAPRSECANDAVSDFNDNDIGGENFVSIHRGIQHMNSKSDLETMSLLDCDDVRLNTNDTKKFTKYFRTEGYNDNSLLCSTLPVCTDDPCVLRDDIDFLDFVKTNDDFDGNDTMLIGVARDSNDFDDFCDHIEDKNKDIRSTFKLIEPNIFNFGNPVAQIRIEC